MKEKSNRGFALLIKYPLTVCVGVILIANLLGYIFGTQTDFSDIENRYLTKRPEVKIATLADGSFMETFETYAAEQIPFRNELVKGKAAMEMLLLKCENNGIARGSDDYLFDKVLGIDEQADKNVAILKNFIETSGRDVVVAIAPTSTAVYPERLPKGMPVLDEKELGKRVENSIGPLENAYVVDLFSVMESHKDEEIYYRTDHHWKSAGAYYAYEAICDALSEIGKKRGDAESVLPYDRSLLTSHEAEGFFGTFNAKYKGIGVNPDTIEYYDIPIEAYEADDEVFGSLYDDTKLEIYDKYAMFMHGNPGHALITANNASNGRKLIVFKDSYANSLIPFLAMNYDTIEVADLRYYGESVAKMLEESPDADILMLYNYSFINEDKHFFKLLR